MSTTSIVKILHGTNRDFLKLFISKTLIKNISVYYGLLETNHYEKNSLQIIMSQSL